jgi:pyrroline-5-carboxylate reductase
MAKVAFLGAGKMASAIVQGILNHKSLSADRMICASAEDGTGQSLASRTGITLEQNLSHLISSSETLVLAIKPQQLKELASDITGRAQDTLIISILAGTPIQRLSAKFPHARNIVRAMPNTPGQIGAGITAFTSREPLSQVDQAIVMTILGALGKVIEVNEPQMDAVTAVSGSGPAYVFEFVAALRDAAICAGIPHELALQLALETTYGAAKLLREGTASPEELRNAVSSPGGTTLAGLAVMQRLNFRDMIQETVLAAQKRSVELASC